MNGKKQILAFGAIIGLAIIFIFWLMIASQDNELENLKKELKEVRESNNSLVLEFGKLTEVMGGTLDQMITLRQNQITVTTATKNLSCQRELDYHEYRAAVVDLVAENKLIYTEFTDLQTEQKRQELIKQGCWENLNENQNKIEEVVSNGSA